MDESRLLEDDCDPVRVNLPIHDSNKFDCKDNMGSLSLRDALKCCLLKFATNGADKVFMDPKFSRSSFCNGIRQLALPARAFHQSFSGERGRSSSKICHVYGECALEQKMGNTGGTLEDEDNLGAKTGSDLLVCKEGFCGFNEWNKEYVDVSEVVNSPSGNYTEFPFNSLAFFAVLLMTLMGFHFNILVSSFTFPIWASYFSFTLLMFPFQTIRRIRGYLLKKLLSWWGISSRNVSQQAQRSMGNIAVRLCCAFFWSSYVYLMLVGLLASGFVFGGLVMRNLVEKPFQTTETMNFDYTRTTPVAFVPIIPDNVDAGKQVGARVIPHNHKLQLKLSLVMPESDYNQKLGVFQVRVEFLSISGEVTGGSSQPCIMRFKSQPIRFVETIFKSAPVIAGFVTESQIVSIKMNEFTEGREPTALLKVMLEQRAEYKAAGAGIPEIYAASLSLESELPPLKRLIWLWKRTVFVWIGTVMFLSELMLALVFCRPIIMPRIPYTKRGPGSNFICWYRTRDTEMKCKQGKE